MFFEKFFKTICFTILIMEKIDLNKLGKTVAVICPHDDDGIIGCGGLLNGLSSKNIKTYAIIMTDGSLGYSKAEQKNTISKIREREAEEAYKLLDTEVIFLGFPDMCLHSYICWKTPDGKEGGYYKLLKTLREIKPDTLFIPNSTDRHPDHQDAYDIASVCSFQLEEPVAVELGKPVKIKNIFSYKVWDKLKKETHIFKLNKEEKEIKKSAISEFKSQEEILKNVDINYEKEEFSLIK